MAGWENLPISPQLPSPTQFPKLSLLLQKQHIDNRAQHSPKVMDNQPTITRVAKPGTEEWRRLFAQFLQSEEMKDQAAALAAERARFEGSQPPPPPPKPRVPPGPLILGPDFQRYAPFEVGTIVSGYALSLKAIWDPDPGPEQGLRLGTRRFSAIATCADEERPTILHLELQPSTGQWIAQKLAGFLPRVLRACLFSLFPEWNLPPRMVLKAQKVPWYDQFDLEKATYARLRPLQGTVIPQLLGEVSYRGNRALLLSDIGGASAASAEGCLMEVVDFGRATRQCMAAVAKFGVTQEDVKLDNYHVVGDKVMAVDFEMVSDLNCPQERLMEETCKVRAEVDAEDMTEEYERYQFSLWEKDKIAVDSR